MCCCRAGIAAQGRRARGARAAAAAAAAAAASHTAQRRAAITITLHSWARRGGNSGYRKLFARARAAARVDRRPIRAA
jgi:ABC-type glycerol-3-phosphate transport system substrate-binding protein